MEKIEGGFSTQVLLTGEEAKTICKIGQDSKCCAFIVASGRGFECIRMSYPANATIFTRLEKGDMNAKGSGGGPGCAWEEELKAESNG